MTTPTEKWTRYLDGENAPSSQYAGIRELVDYAVQLERENKALSVNAENLEILRKERDEARDIARKVLGYMRIENEPDIGDLGIYTQVRREKWYQRKLALLSTFPEWLRREVGG